MAARRAAPLVLEELGAAVTAIGVHPDGRNINQDCGSLRPELICNEVRQSGADLGVALDGDGDSKQSSRTNTETRWTAIR